MVGAGIALDQGASIPNTVLGFAILVALGVTVSGLGSPAHAAADPPAKGDQPHVDNPHHHREHGDPVGRPTRSGRLGDRSPE